MTESRANTKKKTPSTSLRRGSAGSVAVWGEVSLTVAITDEPPQFVKVTFGHERMARNSSTQELRRVRNLIHEFNVEEVERQLDEHRQLILGLEEGKPETVSSRARRRVKR